MTKPQMPQMTPEQWESLATAVDALSSALAAVRPLAEWEMDLLNAATPEPDPWPTAPLIVADWTESAGKSGRGLLYKDDSGDYCPTIDEEVGIVRDYRRDTLSNVVPVTVVPVAELEAHRASIKALGYGTQGGTRGMPGSLLDTALRLLEATDALGVSND